MCVSNVQYISFSFSCRLTEPDRGGNALESGAEGEGGGDIHGVCSVSMPSVCTASYRFHCTQKEQALQSLQTKHDAQEEQLKVAYLQHIHKVRKIYAPFV